MDLRWTTLVLGFGLLGVMALGTDCFGQTQTQQIGAASEKGTDGSGAAKPKAKDDEALAKPPSDWLDRDNRVGLPLLKNIAEDQKALWIGPKSLRFADADWLVPLGGVAAGMFVTDSSYSRHLSNSPNRIKYSKDLSNYGIASMIGIGGGLWVLGHVTHDDHKIETGILAGEAAIDSLVPVYAMKYAFGRERPLQNNYQGRFGQGGVSFPSEHAAAAWSIASVVAHEYPGPLTSLFAYGLASAVSASRITGKQHFPSDVLVGSAIGWLEGMYVYRKHHDARIGGGDWETYAEAHDSSEHRTGNLGSPYVPLDSWIYQAISRLSALGYLDTAILGLRPWTRLECVRLLSEAADRNASAEDSPEVRKLYDALATEFAYEGTLPGDKNLRAQLESVYTRFTNISGPALTDNYHFGQTIINDFGRPFERGLNSVDGASGWVVAGPFVAYARGEYQHAPSAPAPSQAVLSFISQVDGTPSGAPSTPVASTNRFRLLDGYVGMSFANWQVSFGKQSLWWGPNEGGPFLFTDNVEPINMFRINRASPFQLPWIFKLLGNVRLEFFLGQLSGHEFLVTDENAATRVMVGQFGRALNPQPFVNGQKITFKFNRNLEFGVAKTSVYGGPTLPLTFSTFINSIYDVHKKDRQSPLGDGRTSADFSYRIPKLRDWLTFYGEGFSEDEIFPPVYARKSVWQGGLYMPKLPKLSKLDLRFEGGTTLPPDFPGCSNCFYNNTQYLNSYTSNDKLIGSGFGRSAQGEDIRSTYWLSANNRVGIHLRHRKLYGVYIPGGGTENDVSANADFFVGSCLSVSTTVQYESWLIPFLATGLQSNVLASIQFTYLPKGRIR